MNNSDKSTWLPTPKGPEPKTPQPKLMKQFLIKQYRCLYCPDLFHSIAGVKTHMREKHNEEWICC